MPTEVGRHENKEYLAKMRVVLEELKSKRARQEPYQLSVFYLNHEWPWLEIA